MGRNVGYVEKDIFKEITTIAEWKKYGVNIKDYTTKERDDAQNIDFLVMREILRENLRIYDDLMSMKPVGKTTFPEYAPWGIGPIPKSLKNAIAKHAKATLTRSYTEKELDDITMVMSLTKMAEKEYPEKVPYPIKPFKPKTVKEKVKAKVKAKIEKKVAAKKPTPAPKVPYVEEHPELKKKPKPKPTPTPKPAPKKVVKKAVKPKPAPKPKTKHKKTLKGTKLTAKQKKHLKDQGYVNITHNKKKYRITPSRVKRGIIQK